MKHTQLWLSTAILLVLIGSTVGCRSKASQPWAGNPYRPPMGYSNQSMATYAPMPKILPSTRSPEIRSSVPVDDTPEAILAQPDW